MFILFRECMDRQEGKCEVCLSPCDVCPDRDNRTMVQPARIKNPPEPYSCGFFLGSAPLFSRPYFVSNLVTIMWTM